MITLDAKADQFVKDENMDYITNRPKKPVVNIEPKPVHEGLEVSGKTYSGEINALFENLMEKLKAKAKIDGYDKTNIEMDAYNALITEFVTELATKIQENPAILGSGDAVVKEAIGEIVEAMKNMNYSGGPIPTKNYDIIEKEEQQQEQQPEQQNPQQPQNPNPDNHNGQTQGPSMNNENGNF